MVEVTAAKRGSTSSTNEKGIVELGNYNIYIALCVISLDIISALL